MELLLFIVCYAQCMYNISFIHLILYCLILIRSLSFLHNYTTYCDGILQANTIACAASLESARLIENGHGNTWFDPSAYNGLGGVKSSFTEDDIYELSLLPGVKGVMSLGSVLSVELGNTSVAAAPSSSTSSSTSTSAVTTTDNAAHENPTTSSSSSSTSSSSSSSKNARYYNSSVSSVVVSLLKQNGVYARPLGNVVYLMPTPLTPEADRQNLIHVLKRLVLHQF